MRLRFTRVRGLLVALLVSLGSCTSAPPVRTTAAPEASEPATPGLFLYEVRGKGKSAHLLGTIHVGFGFDEVLTDEARARFHSAERVMTEADVSAADPRRLIEAALLPADRSLSVLLGPEAWQQLLARLGDQIPAALLDRLEPWLPAVMLGLRDLEQALARLKPGAETRLMDIELMKQAKELGKQLDHLETVDQQIAIFESIPLEEQVRELRETLASDAGTQADQLLTAFAKGDQRELERAVFDPSQAVSAAGFYERVLFERNLRWLPIIEREIARGHTFIAVGAAHLLGAQGVLSELKKRGYSVTRVH